MDKKTAIETFGESLKVKKNENGSFSFLGICEENIYTVRLADKKIVIDSEPIDETDKSLFEFFN